MTAAQQSDTTSTAVTLRARTLRSTAWVAAAYSGRLAIRFGSNLILTWLLFREAFGVVSTVYVVLGGLEMLADIGLGPSIIHHPKGETPEFLGTAWTIQVLRGFCLAVLGLVIAVPLSLFYADSLSTIAPSSLAGMIATAGLGAAIRGFTSPRIYALQRRLRLQRIVVLDLAVGLLGSCATIATALAWRSPWALLVGALLSDVLRVIGSHTYLAAGRCGFRWQREAAAALVRAGRWILLSSALTYLAAQLDRLMLPRLLGMESAGVYGIAVSMVLVVVEIGHALSHNVLFPMLAETVRESKDRIVPRLRKVRRYWVVPACLLLTVLSVAGDALVHLLYHDQYSDAGWMLRLLAAGAIPRVVFQSYAPMYSALGQFRKGAYLNAVRVPILAACMLVGWRFDAPRGVVMGVAVADVLMYPFIVQQMLRWRVWTWRFDLTLMSACLGICVGAAMLQ